MSGDVMQRFTVSNLPGVTNNRRFWKSRAKTILAASCVLLALWSSAWADTPSALGVLEFLDGASLHGRLRSMSPERGVGWEHPEAKQLIEFRPANLASIV